MVENAAFAYVPFAKDVNRKIAPQEVSPDVCPLFNEFSINSAKAYVVFDIYPHMGAFFSSRRQSVGVGAGGAGQAGDHWVLAVG
ncbi:MAG: hypothetical protein PHV34_03800 [Verrucomicrobiae bacterium]|nr:hypothetical protein [Verrucomicrobiae bacterium]